LPGIARIILSLEEKGIRACRSVRLSFC